MSFKKKPKNPKKEKRDEIQEVIREDLQMEREECLILQKAINT